MLPVHSDVSAVMPTIRDESIQDAETVNVLLDQAFGRQAEARLVDRLRAGDKVAAAMIAEQNGRMLGHVVFSRVSVSSGRSDFAALALAPLAVLPAFQRLGVGSALVSAGLERCRNSGHARVLVVGDPAYYSRFGFVPAARYGVRPPFETPPDTFMALELQPGAFAAATGVARYGHEFDDLG